MNKSIFHLICGCFAFLTTAALIGCTQEDNLEAPSGLRIALKEFHQEVDSRTVPAELEKPLAEKFDVEIRESSSNHLAHSGKITNELIPLSTGT